MRFLSLVLSAAAAAGANALAVNSSSTSTSATAAVEALVERRLPEHVDSFVFSIVNASATTAQGLPVNDTYSVSSTDDGMIHVEGNSVSGLLSG